MTLKANELMALAHGAIRCKVSEDGFVSFFRFTERQEAYYRETNPDFYKKTFATSNIRIELVTDADEISFAYRTKKASSRKFCFVDLFVDGVMVAHEGESDCENATGTVTLALPEGTHTVTVYLPCLFGLEMGNFTLSDGATATPTSKSRKMLIFGDSITQGYDAVYPSQSYANLITDMLHATAVNQGIGGEVFNPGLIDGDLGFTPDIITVAYGTNDYSKRTREDMVRDANEFYRRLRATFPTAKIFALLPIWRGDTAKKVSAVGSFEEAKAIVRAAAEAQPNTVVLDGNTFVPHLPEFFSDKYLHPNDFGFKFYADGVLTAMMPHLTEA